MTHAPEHRADSSLVREFGKPLTDQSSEKAPPRSLGYAHRADVVAACGAGHRVEFSTQPDLAGRACHGAGATGKRDQRRESSLSGWQIDRSGVGTKEFITALQSDDAVPGEVRRWLELQARRLE